jgi:NitT/TauT family transport system permease protein
LCTLIVFFPILVVAVSGLAHIDHDVVDAARIDGAPRRGSAWCTWSCRWPRRR